MMIKLSVGARLAGALLPLLLAGCMSSSHELPANYRLQMDTTAATNAGAPLKVRVLLLKSDADFMSADFYSLQTQATNLLGSNLLDTGQFFLTQGQPMHTLTGQPPLDAHYLGIIAEYQSINGKKWRISLPLPQPKSTNFYKFWQISADEMKAHVIATGSGLSIQQDKN